MTTNDTPPSDIVERLNAPLEHYYWEYGTAALQKDAAAEIERLRDRLSGIEKLTCWNALDDTDCPCCEDVMETILTHIIAREALNQ